MAGTVGTVMTRGQFTDLFKNLLPYMEEILFKNLEAPDLTYTQVFNVRDSDRFAEEMTGVVGFGQFSKKPEGGKIEYDSLSQAFDKRLTHDTFGKGSQITFEALRDDAFRAITDVLPELSRVARNSIETDAFAVFNNSFGSETTPDGKSIFNAAHILEKGGTFDNVLSTDFGQGALEEAINIFDDMRDGSNQLIKSGAAMILYPPKLKWQITEVLQSEMKSDTANNTMNVVNRLGLGQVESKYLTDDDAWFVLSEPSQHKIMYFWRDEPFTDSALDFDTRNLKTAMLYASSRGAFDWRNMVASPGA
jgi:hypothetical protein